jgi:hypothetical protein
MVQLGMVVMKVGALGLKTWVEVEKELQLQGTTALSNLTRLNVRALLYHNEFTKNPCKVVHLNFHRILYLEPTTTSTSQFNTIQQQKPGTTGAGGKADPRRANTLSNSGMVKTGDFKAALDENKQTAKLLL